MAMTSDISTRVPWLTVDLEAHLLARGAQPVVGDADVHARVVAVQGHDLESAVREQPVPAYAAVDLHREREMSAGINNTVFMLSK